MRTPRLPDDVWIDDVARWIIKGTMWGFAIVTTAVVLVAYGEARMSKVALQAFTDAEYCHGIIDRTLTTAERAGDATLIANATLAAFLHVEPRVDVVAER